MRDARMRCAMLGCDARCTMRDAGMRCAMLGCDARCQDAMRDARMRCAMLHSIAHRASHPSIAHRILASRIVHRVHKGSWNSWAPEVSGRVQISSANLVLGETGASPPLFQLTASSISIKIARHGCVG